MIQPRPVTEYTGGLKILIASQDDQDDLALAAQIICDKYCDGDFRKSAKAISVGCPLL